MNSTLALRDWRLIVTVILLLVTFFGLQGLSHGTPTLTRKSLEQLPHRVDSWEARDFPIEEEVQKALGATELLNRVYQDPQTKISLGLFVAFFESQRKGGSIHSPKNCLPGSGWEPVKWGTTPLEVAGYPNAVEVNRYVIQKDLDKQIVLYWYQSQGRIIASEYSAKAYLVWDALTKNRTDGALVRIVSPVIQGDEAAALERATSFARNIFPMLQEHIPN